MIHARENLDTFLISWLVPECAQDDIGKRDEFLPAQAPDSGEFAEAIALCGEHGGLQLGHITVRFVINAIQEVRAAGPTEVRREGCR